MATRETFVIAGFAVLITWARLPKVEPVATIAPSTKALSRFCALASAVLPVSDVYKFRAPSPASVTKVVPPIATAVPTVPHPARAAPPVAAVVASITGARTTPIFPFATVVL